MSRRHRKLSLSPRNSAFPENDDPGLPAPLRPPTQDARALGKEGLSICEVAHIHHWNRMEWPRVDQAHDSTAHHPRFSRPLRG